MARRPAVKGGRPALTLAALGVLLLAYLVVPVAAFLVRLAGGQDGGFGQPGLWSALWVSVAGASIATAVTAVLGIPLAWVLARSRSLWASAATAAVFLPLAVPPLMSGILLVYVAGPYTFLGRHTGHRLTDTLLGVVLAQTFVASPFLVVAARSAFAAQDRSLFDVAAALGHGPLRRFFLVAVPAAGPAIRAGVLLTWLRAFGEYGATVLLAYHPSSLPVYTYVTFSGTGLADTAAPTAISLAIAAAVVAVGRLPVPHRRSPSRVEVTPAAPTAACPVAVQFDIALRLGDFLLEAAHRSSTHRLAILGPSGSGKTMTLRAVAGLPSSGEGRAVIRYGTDDVSDIPADRRRVGYVPQGYRLLPHLDVWRQLGFAVDAEPQVAAYWAAAMGIEGLGARMPHELSGGQRQRVSLAQALSRQPRLLLLDEPFSALDVPVRSELARELRALQRRSGLSTVLVTHDPEEAALLADEIVVLVGGTVAQAGSPTSIWSSPASPVVARLTGCSNILAGTAGSDGHLQAGGHDLFVQAGVPGTPVWWGIRPEDVSIGDPSGVWGEVVDVALLGSAVEVEVRLAPGMVVKARTRRGVPPIGHRCPVALPADAITVWPRLPAAVPNSVHS